MSKKHIGFVVVVIFLILLSTAVTTQAADHSIQAKYLPRQVSNLYLGMPLREFKAIRNVSPTEDNEEANDLFDFRTERTEFIKDNEVGSITYYFAKDSNESLYEVILEYHGNFNVRGFAASKYGPSNYKSEWRFDSGEGFGIMIWVYKNKLIIAGTIKGTAWEKGKTEATPTE